MSAVETTFGIIDEEQSKQMLLLAERMAGVGHWLIDLRRNTLYWSDEIYRIHGVTAESYEPELDSAIAFYHPDDVESVRAAVSRAVDDKQPFEFEARVIQPSGESRVVNSKSIVQPRRKRERGDNLWHFSRCHRLSGGSGTVAREHRAL